MVRRKRDAAHADDIDVATSFAEVNNPAFAAARGPKRRVHPFEGDEHGHDRHDTLPAEEEWAEDELRPGEEHNPKRR